MLLSYHELRQEVQAAQVISPIEDAQVNASSIDVRLGSTILVERSHPDGPQLVSLRDRTTLAFDTVTLEENGSPFILEPGQFILAHTLEVFNLPLTLSAEFALNSSAARMGLGHALAGWADAGWNNSTLTLELHNQSQQHRIALYHGDRIGQMIFFRHTKVPFDRSYAARGAYNGQLRAMPAQPNKSPVKPAPAPTKRRAAAPAIPGPATAAAKPWERG